MARSAATLLFAGLVAIATGVLSACGPVAGSAHAVEPGPPAADRTTAAPAAGAPGGDASGGTGNPGSTGGGSNGGGSNGGGTDPTPAAPAAAITSFRVVQQPTCPVRGTPDAPYSAPGTDVEIAWTVTGADRAAIAVDDPDVYGAYGSDYPASGSLSLPFGCDTTAATTHTYTVWPAGAPDVSRTVTVSASPNG